MSEGYKLTFTVVGILILAAAVVMAATKRGDHHGFATIRVGPLSLEVTGVGTAMAAVGLAAMTIPWALAAFGIEESAAGTVLDARQHPASEYQTCQPPTGIFIVEDNLPDGPLAVRTGAATQYLEIDALGSGSGGLRFDECVQRHNGATPWWRVDGSGWLFSGYVERE